MKKVSGRVCMIQKGLELAKGGNVPDLKERGICQFGEK
jgi:hypothetical protein